MGETFQEGPRAAYADRLAHHTARRDAAAVASGRLSNARAITVVLALASWLAFDVMESGARSYALGAIAVLLVAFVAQVVVHRRVRRRERWDGALAAVANEGLLRLARDWAALDEALPAAERASDEPATGHAYARDLAVVGRASLERLAGPVTSEPGRALLRAWLLGPTHPEAARKRQGAVRELAALPELRAEVASLGRLHGPERLSGLEAFLVWAEERGNDAASPLVRALSWTLPPLMLAGVVAHVTFGWPPWWLAPALVQFAIWRRHAPRAGAAFQLTESAAPALRALVPQLRRLSVCDWSDLELVALAEGLGRGGDAAHLRLGTLSRILDTVASRRNLIYATLAPGLMLDVHLCAALERWRRAHGPSVRKWVEALGAWEATAALATIAHDNPDWAYPTLAGGDAHVVEARALGHPLLPPGSCVRNDVVVGPPGTFLFVTGSNMSGKSTLLRAIGANAVLAAAGAPACASSLRLPPVHVYTSMRVEDSLTEGVSLFMAELLRLKDVVEGARLAQAEGGRVLYLLDEILHGTNTEERGLAARAIVRHLIASGAIGAVSTHDLSLADAPDLRPAAQAVHFREEVGARAGPQHAATLTFDYVLRSGIATTRNALALLEAVGLGAPDPPTL